MGVTVGEREVGRIVGHGMALGLQAPAHVGQREVSVLCLRDSYRLYTVTLMAVGSGIEGIAQAHVGVEGIITGACLFLRHGVVERDAHFRLVREELA